AAKVGALDWSQMFTYIPSHANKDVLHDIGNLLRDHIRSDIQNGIPPLVESKVPHLKKDQTYKDYKSILQVPKRDLRKRSAEKNLEKICVLQFPIIPGGMPWHSNRGTMMVYK
ncbi:hypothetical protein MPER_02393, partial [Moniliophthora perniciosa FA553]